MESGTSEPFVLGAGGVAAVAKALARTFGTPALRDAVKELVAIAYFLAEEKESPAAADAIIGVVDRALPELDKLGVDVAEVFGDAIERAGDRQAAARRVLGLGAPTAAPKTSPAKNTGSLQAEFLAARIRC